MTAATFHHLRDNCARRFEPAGEEFERNFAERGELGASWRIYVEGEPVVGLRRGVKDATTGKPRAKDTMNVIFSRSKGLAAICGNIGSALNARGHALIDATYGVLGSISRAPGFWVRAQ